MLLPGDRGLALEDLAGARQPGRHVATRHGGWAPWKLPAAIASRTVRIAGSGS